MPGDRAVELRAERLEVVDHTVVGVHGVDAVLAAERAGGADHSQEWRLRAPADLRTRAGPVLLSVRRAEGADTRDGVGALCESDRAPIERPRERIPDLRHVRGIVILHEQPRRAPGGIADAHAVVSVERVKRAVRADDAAQRADRPDLVVLIKERRAAGGDVDQVQRRSFGWTDGADQKLFPVGGLAERRRVVRPTRRAAGRDDLGARSPREVDEEYPPHLPVGERDVATLGGDGGRMRDDRGRRRRGGATGLRPRGRRRRRRARDGDDHEKCGRRDDPHAKNDATRYAIESEPAIPVMPQPSTVAVRPFTASPMTRRSVASRRMNTSTIGSRTPFAICAEMMRGISEMPGMSTTIAPSTMSSVNRLMNTGASRKFLLMPDSQPKASQIA